MIEWYLSLDEPLKYWLIPGGLMHILFIIVGLMYMIVEYYVRYNRWLKDTMDDREPRPLWKDQGEDIGTAMVGGFAVCMFWPLALVVAVAYWVWRVAKYMFKRTDKLIKCILLQNRGKELLLTDPRSQIRKLATPNKEKESENEQQ